MWSAAYVIAAACIGYVFCLNCYKFQYSLARKSGYYSYLYCTSFGIVFLALGVWIDWDWFRADWLSAISINVNVFANPLFADIFSGISVALIALIVFNTLIDKTQSIQMAWKDDLSVVLWKAIELELPVQITLDTRKVYIGQVFDTIEPDEDSSFLSIVPLLSGHRLEDTLELKITHKYHKVIQDLKNKEESKIAAYQLVIPKARIVTCHIFDPKLYQDIRRQQSTGPNANLRPNE